MNLTPQLKAAQMPSHRIARTLSKALLLAVLLPNIAAQIPAGYYSSVDTTSPGTLRASLHEIIDDHSFFPYTSSSTDTWDVLELAMEDPADSGRILDIYKNASYAKQGGGNSFYNREHVWPKSYGFPDEGIGNIVHNDCHMLWLADSSYNLARSNKPFRDCSSTCTEWATELNDGQGGVTGSYPADSNWTEGSSSTGSWETWHGRRGDVARALFYAEVRYEGDTHGALGIAEPDLLLTNDQALITASLSQQNEQVAYMGMLSVLLQWHLDDPVDAWELQRNDMVADFQGNRNPFIDHPEWVACLFAGQCSGGDMTPPAAPTGLTAVGGQGRVDLDWNDNGEPDLLGYDVFRASSPGGLYVPITSSPLATSEYADTAVLAGETWHYVVVATDFVLNDSAASNEVSATVSQFRGDLLWINELHYDNSGTDEDEFVEIAGPSGANLSGWQLLLYNGNNGSLYDSAVLSGFMPYQPGCLGTVLIPFGQIQNGSPDGIALVSPTNNVVEFLSYEGNFVAVGGAADGLTSTDINVTESGSTPVGFSLQRGGSGAVPGHFAWQSAQASTPGEANSNQTFDGCNLGGWTDLGGGTSGAGGPVTLTGAGALSAGSPTTLELNHTPVGALTLAWVAFESLPFEALGGTVHAIPFANQLLFVTDSSGDLNLATSWPFGIPSGTPIWFQFVVEDSSVIYSITLSNGLLVTAH
jgi:endonuclease I